MHVKTAAVVGVQEGALSRRKFMFQIDLEWSDESKTTSFRSYSDFFDLQCGLLSSFPREGGLEKGHERTLPFLPGKKLFSRSTRQLAEQRRPDIDDYVQKLTALPPHISRSDAVLSFFRSNWKEDRLRTGEGRGSLPRHGPAVKYSVEYSKTQSIGAKLVGLAYVGLGEGLLELVRLGEDCWNMWGWERIAGISEVGRGLLELVRLGEDCWN